MPTKQQIRKYIHNIKTCNRIEVFHDRDSKSSWRWFHYISRKGEFLGFSVEIPSPNGAMDEFIKGRFRYMTSKTKISDVGDASIYGVRKYHVRDNMPDGVIVRKHGKWTWIK